jgi:hypothetical protein
MMAVAAAIGASMGICYLFVMMMKVLKDANITFTEVMIGVIAIFFVIGMLVFIAGRYAKKKDCQ